LEEQMLHDSAKQRIKRLGSSWTLSKGSEVFKKYIKIHASYSFGT
jgi:hypothetical protein